MRIRALVWVRIRIRVGIRTHNCARIWVRIRIRLGIVDNSEKRLKLRIGAEYCESVMGAWNACLRMHVNGMHACNGSL